MAKPCSSGFWPKYIRLLLNGCLAHVWLVWPRFFGKIKIKKVDEIWQLFSSALGLYRLHLCGTGRCWSLTVFRHIMLFLWIPMWSLPWTLQGQLRERAVKREDPGAGSMIVDFWVAQVLCLSTSSLWVPQVFSWVPQVLFEYLKFFLSTSSFFWVPQVCFWVPQVVFFEYLQRLGTQSSSPWERIFRRPTGAPGERQKCPNSSRLNSH